MDPLTLPSDFDSENVPAHVMMSGDNRRAYVFHPLGLKHPSAEAAIARLTRRNIAVLNAPAAA